VPPPESVGTPSAPSHLLARGNKSRVKINPFGIEQRHNPSRRPRREATLTPRAQRPTNLIRTLPIPGLLRFAQRRVIHLPIHRQERRLLRVLQRHVPLRIDASRLPVGDIPGSRTHRLLHRPNRPKSRERHSPQRHQPNQQAVLQRNFNKHVSR